ncbi:MAG: DNA repair protein RecO [Candidatus Woesebacteria bacterium]|nr:DNA repair protein RecO [Candidatus Woesebacteria bacterium]
MRFRSYSDEGIVLARRNFGEADRILSIYSKNHGRISAIAKGIRRTTSRKRGHLEVFGHIKFQITDGHGIGILIEADTINNFEEIRKDLKKISLAYFFTEVIGKITHEHERNDGIFELTLNYLEKLQLETRLRSLRMSFILELLTITGFWPEGKKLVNPDEKLEEVVERSINSLRVGRKVLR